MLAKTFSFYAEASEIFQIYELSPLMISVATELDVIFTSHSRDGIRTGLRRSGRE